MVEISAVTASQCYICLQVCCFVVGVYFLVCIIRKLIHEERKKEVDIKQTTGMAIDFSGEWMTCLLQVSRPAAEYARCKMPAAEFLLRRAFCMTGLSVNVSRLMMCFIFMVRKQNKCDLIPMPVSLHYKVTARRDNTLFMLWENGTKGLSVLLGRTIWKEQPRTISRLSL
ncbi:uncharacterized protein LOC136012048 isoform X3 [Lathamus discolor]|uniref:uncharacterized protein LOC136012048 isoform X3 n=1 Tax=Lathamus discolor TaxID=678569 RepID=UPI0032B803DF